MQTHVASATGEDFAFCVVDNVANGFFVEPREDFELLRGSAGQNHFNENVLEVVSVVDSDDEFGAEGVHVDHETVQQRPRKLLLRLVHQLQRQSLVAQAILAHFVRVAVDEVHVAFDGQHGPDSPLDSPDDHFHKFKPSALNREELNALVPAREQNGERAGTGFSEVGQAEQNFVDSGFR